MNQNKSPANGTNNTGTDNTVKDNNSDTTTYTVFKPSTNMPLKHDPKQRYTKDQCQQIYDARLAKHADKPVFSLIDGPPYANGHIHIGHTVNKIQKDIFNEINFMLGKKVVYVTGSDCHGLPIEKNIEMQLKEEAKDPLFNIKAVDPNIIRTRCREFAAQWIQIQNNEFAELGVFGDWDHHFATMDHANSILEFFHKCVAKDLIYLGNKPVMWSIAEQTSMATAEVEYKPHESTAIDVMFPVIKSNAFQSHAFESHVLRSNTYIIIWTTTPWTIPANRAIAYNPELEYVVLEILANANKESIDNQEIEHKKIQVCVAKNLLDAFLKRCNIIDYKVIQEFQGSALEGTVCQHPLKKVCENSAEYDFPVPLLSGEHVTDTDGTGFVHTAPSHGEEDFALGVKYGLEITNIVAADGTFQNTPRFAGLSFKQAQKAILEDLQPALLSQHIISHSYPYSWRSHTPLIYRVTPQWYMKLNQSASKNSIKEKVQEAANNIQWIPANSKNRFEGMLNNRGDWCISRQRAWGTPLALFIAEQVTHEQTDTNTSTKSFVPIFDPEVLAKTRDFLSKDISLWWKADIKEILGEELLSKLEQKYCNITKVMDILDVWFDAGCMQYCLKNGTQAPCDKDTQDPTNQELLKRHKEVAYPADMYLEGSDQHRGFFQACLCLNSLECEDECNKACSNECTNASNITSNQAVKTILTHGFILDGKGRKMSKSLGNVVPPSQLLEYGVDVTRLWVALADCTDDIRYSKIQMDKALIIYNRFRNTIRYLLASLHNYKHDSTQSNAKHASQLPGLECNRSENHKAQQNLYLSSIYSYCQETMQEFMQKIGDKPHTYRTVYQDLYHFCDDDLSSFLFDINKDILYCDDIESPARQQLLDLYYTLAKTLILTLAPVLKLTAQEAWTELINKENSNISDHNVNHNVHLATWDLSDKALHTGKINSAQMDTKVYQLIKHIRNLANKEIETLRAEKIINQTQQAEVIFTLNQTDFYLLSSTLKNCVGQDDFKHYEHTTHEQANCESMICELIRFVTMTAKATIVISSDTSFTSSCKATPFNGYKCLRCRRFFDNINDESLCVRCVGCL